MVRAGALLAAALIAGCASDRAVLLLAIDVGRTDAIGYRPVPHHVPVEQPGGRRLWRFPVHAGAVAADGAGVRLARLELDPGTYRVCGVSGSATAVLLTAHFHVPLLLDVEAAPGAVTYVGRVTARLRERGKDDFRAGPTTPVWEQRVSGFSGSTWDIAVEDRTDADLALFRERFPELAQATVTTAVAAFDRGAVQRWADARQTYAEAEYSRAANEALGRPTPLKPAAPRPKRPESCRGIDLF